MQGSYIITFDFYKSHCSDNVEDELRKSVDYIQG